MVEGLKLYVVKGICRMLKDSLSVVFVGHVDHGKSSVLGRLLADTSSLPEGKLENIRQNCEQNGKPLEYAFLIDALRDEQDQGITIDAARIFLSLHQESI